jgi:hypothetical protein
MIRRARGAKPLGATEGLVLLPRPTARARSTTLVPNVVDHSEEKLVSGDQRGHQRFCHDQCPRACSTRDASRLAPPQSATPASRRHRREQLDVRAGELLLPRFNGQPLVRSDTGCGAATDHWFRRPRSSRPRSRRDSLEHLRARLHSTGVRAVGPPAPVELRLIREPRQRLPARRQRTQPQRNRPYGRPGRRGRVRRSPSFASCCSQRHQSARRLIQSTARLHTSTSPSPTAASRHTTLPGALYACITRPRHTRRGNGQVRDL